MIASALRFLIDVVFGLFTYALLLRFVMQLLRAPFRNPAGQAVMALTDWIVKPLRKIFPGFKGIDWASLFATYLFQVLWLLAYYLVFGKGFDLQSRRPPADIAPPRPASRGWRPTVRSRDC